jgi:hypothetical protein
MAEIDLMRRLQIVASQLGARLFRQNSGMAWVGKVQRGPATVRLGTGDVVLRNARPFHAGFEGLSDLGGFVPVEITPDMVGSTVAVYAQVEVKAGAATSKEQAAWIDLVNANGGRAGVAKSEADLAVILRGIR